MVTKRNKKIRNKNTEKRSNIQKTRKKAKIKVK
jgi:hypothetical protein